MENFMNLKPKDIKLLKEHIKKLHDLVDGDEPSEEDVGIYSELIDFFNDITEDLKMKLYDITGYESTDDMEEEAEEEKTEKTEEVK